MFQGEIPRLETVIAEVGSEVSGHLSDLRVIQLSVGFFFQIVNHMESEFEVQCPYCGEMIWMEFYPEEGESQEMVIDCEVCCNPILYSIRYSRDGDVRLRVERAQ